MGSVGILTFLHNDNYGSALQAYALQRAVREETGRECEHLDYQPDAAEKIRNLLRSGNSPKLILEGLRKKSVRAEQAEARQKSREIPEFYARRMRLSVPCRNGRELREAGRRHEILLCGSDQIWNPVWLNQNYFLTFGEKGQRKMAYAASLGVSSLPPENKGKMIRRWTADFEAVSIREEEGATLFRQMTGREAQVMPDPVCLLSPAEWLEIAGDSPAGDPYLLCYFIGANAQYWKETERLSRETGLRPLVIPVTAESYRSGHAMLGGMGPEGFLGAIRGAARLMTDSFHGLVLATILGTPVTLLRRDRDGDPESRNSRADHFLRLMKTRGTDALREQGRDWLRRTIKHEEA